MMKTRLKLYKQLSIDICLGALSGGIFFAKAWRTGVPRFYYIALPLAVWVIYTFDHYLDSLKSKADNNFGTYEFHKKNKLILIAICVVIGLFLLIGSFYFFPKKILIITFLPVILTGLYYAINNFKPIPLIKELIISIVYCFGIAYVPFFYATGFSIGIFILYFLIVFINVLLFSVIEHEQDTVNNKITFDTYLGYNFVKTIIYILLFAGMFVSVFLLVTSANMFIIPIVLILCTEFIILYSKLYLKQKVFSSLLLDGVFILPGIIALLFM